MLSVAVYRHRILRDRNNQQLKLKFSTYNIREAWGYLEGISVPGAHCFPI